MKKLDLRGNFFHINKIVKIKIINIISNIINHSICKFKNIPLGKKCSFSGFTIFNRKPHSKITIGSRCRFLSINVANHIGINRRCIVSTLSNNAILEIGEGCGFSGTVIGAFSNIYIGNNVRCGANTTITDSNWHNDDPRAGNPSPTTINDNVWLGLNVTVLKGVTIGKNTVVGANSIVTKNLPENCFAAGNPAKVVKYLTKNEVDKINKYFK